MNATQLYQPTDVLTQSYHATLYDHTPAPRRLLRINDIPQQRMPPPQQLPVQGQPHPSTITSQQQQQQQQRQDRDPIQAVGIPAITPDGIVMVDDPNSRSTRSYTPVKLVGDGSFGTVWLCDWHGTLPANTPLSPMQCGAGARPDWVGKRLVAVKRMKKRWEGGWEECSKLKELESLRLIPRHPNIIPLYDYFLLPDTKELYFVFECMEGNLYQLIKSRKGRPLAGGLVSSIFRQVVLGLHHIHQSGYFHRDMKPENLLVTTTGLHDYAPTNPNPHPNANPRAHAGTNPHAHGPLLERDVAVIVKLADFGLAREISSAPPYTEYVSTRWYRAPEVLLRSRSYSEPVDMWALGTIMAELVNLKPLFPGQGEIDQVALICEVLGDPSDEYGTDERGVPRGGGSWPRGIEMARAVGFAFAKMEPKQFDKLFDPNVPPSLIECIGDLLKYEPRSRLTSGDCVNHRYLRETAPRNQPPPPPQPSPPRSNSNGNASALASQQHQQHSRQYAANATAPRTHGHPHPTHSHPHPTHPHSHPHTLSQAAIPPSHPSYPHNQPTTHSHLALRSPPHHYLDPASPESSGSVSPSPMSPYLASSLSPGGGGGPGAGAGAGAGVGATTHLTEQLRELGLPGEDLSVYGQRYHPGGAGDRDSSPTKLELAALQHQQHQQQQQHQQTRFQRPLEGDVDMHGDPRSVLHHHHPQKPEDHPHGAAAASGGGKTGGGLFGGFGKKSKTWGLFGGGDKSQTLPPVEEIVDPSSSTPSLKRTQSGSTSDSRSLQERERELSMPNGMMGGMSPSVIVTGVAGPSGLSTDDSKKTTTTTKAGRATREDLKARRQAETEQQRARSRAVMQKRDMLLTRGEDLDWKSSTPFPGPMPVPRAGGSGGVSPLDKGKGRSKPVPPMLHPVRRGIGGGGGGGGAMSVGVGSGSSGGSRMDQSDSMKNLIGVIREGDEEGDLDDYHEMMRSMGPRNSKARRRDMDDDHSMSSADMRSNRRLSVNTIDSDPGPARPRQQQLRERGSALNINIGIGALHRATSQNSLRSALSTGNSSSVRGYSSSARSSTSLDQGFVSEFASMGAPGAIRRVASPSEMSPPLPLSHSHSHHQHPLTQSQHLHHPPRPPEMMTGSSPTDPHHLLQHHHQQHLHQHQHQHQHPHPSSSSSPSRPMHSPHQYITLPPISSISNPPLPPSNSGFTGLVDKGSHETLHAAHDSGYGTIHPPGSPMNPMFHVPLAPSSSEDVNMMQIPSSHGRPSLPPFSHIASVADQGADNMGDGT